MVIRGGCSPCARAATHLDPRRARRGPQWENAVGQLERAELTRVRSGREPMVCTSLWRWRRQEVIPLLRVRPHAAPLAPGAGACSA
jgi:hypothetical protein